MMIQKRYGRVLGLLVLLLPALVFVGLVGRAESQEKRNRALIAAIKRDEAPAVERLLREGADPNAAEGTVRGLSPWQQFVRMCRRALGERSGQDASGPSALGCAVAVDDTEIARALLRRGAQILPTETVETRSKPWQHDSEVLPPLLAAVRNGNVDLVQLLLTQGARLDTRSDRGATALIIAVHSSPDYSEENPVHATSVFRASDSQPYIALTHSLLERGADPNALTQENESAIARAAAYNQNEMVADLLARGADPDRGVYNSRTALTSATGYRNLPVMRLLLAHGAHVNPNGYDPPLTAVCDAASANLLLDHGADVNSRLPESSDAGDTALMCMARESQPALVRLLVARGADVNAVSTRSRQTTLMCAVDADGFATVRFLLQHRAEVNAANRYGQTALLLAMSVGQYDIVKLLLAYGAKTDVRDDNGASALHYAAWHDNPAIVRLLLLRGASIDPRDKTGATPLAFAARENRVGMARLLLTYGANVNTRDKQGKTPLSAALEVSNRNNRKIVALLKQAGGKK